MSSGLLSICDGKIRAFTAAIVQDDIAVPGRFVTVDTKVRRILRTARRLFYRSSISSRRMRSCGYSYRKTYNQHETCFFQRCRSDTREKASSRREIEVTNQRSLAVDLPCGMYLIPRHTADPSPHVQGSWHRHLVLVL